METLGKLLVLCALTVALAGCGGLRFHPAPDMRDASSTNFNTLIASAHQLQLDYAAERNRIGKDLADNGLGTIGFALAGAAAVVFDGSKDWLAAFGLGAGANQYVGQRFKPAEAIQTYRAGIAALECIEPLAITLQRAVPVGTSDRPATTVLRNQNQAALVSRGVDIAKYATLAAALDDSLTELANAPANLRAALTRVHHWVSGKVLAPLTAESFTVRRDQLIQDAIEAAGKKKDLEIDPGGGGGKGVSAFTLGGTAAGVGEKELKAALSFRADLGTCTEPLK